jgi:pimeloyl-ACP methyl ester carboxylesterase
LLAVVRFFCRLPSLEEMVDRIEGIRRALGLAPWLFWGMSGGGWLAQIYAHRYPEALAGMVIEGGCLCFHERLADPPPALILCGTADPVVPVHHARAVHEATAGSGFVEIEGGGHVPVTERRPEVTKAFRSFVSRLGPRR